MPDEINERGRLQAICAELLGREPGSLFAVQIARVLTHVLCGETAAVTSPLGVILAFRSKTLIPAALIHLCRWEQLVAPNGKIPEQGATAIAFAACLYPRRISRLTEWEQTAMHKCFVELYAADEPDCAERIIGFLIERGRLPKREGIEQEVLGLLADMCPADEVGTERAERLACAALHLATYPKDAIERPAQAGEQERGLLAYWKHDGEFVRFLRSGVRLPPSRLCFKVTDDSQTPQWEVIQTRLAAQLGLAPESPFVKKAVDLDQMLWRRRPPKRISPEDFGELATDFWSDQIEKLRHGFPHYSFESHFVRWWQACAVNLRNQIERTPEGVAVALPKRCKKKAEEPPPRPIPAGKLWRIREGWRLIRTTFSPRRGGAAAVIDDFRHVLDQLFKYHLQKNVCLAPPEAELDDLCERFEIQKNTAFTNLSQIRQRLMSCDWARTEGLGNQAIELRFQTEGINVKSMLLHRDIAGLVRPFGLQSTLLWPFTTYLFFRSALDPLNPDPWDFSRYAEELRLWIDDPLFFEAVTAPQAGRPDRLFVVALTELLGELPDLSFDRAGDSSPYDKLRELILAALVRASGAGGANNPNDLIAAWAERILVRAVGKCGLSIYRNLRELFGSGPRRVGDFSEWIPITWYLIFVERMPFDADRISRRLIVDREEDRRAVRRIVKSMQDHCDESGGNE